MVQGAMSYYVGRAYGTQKKLDNYLFLLTIFGPVYYGPPLELDDPTRMPILRDIHSV